MSDDTPTTQGYRIHSGPFDSEDKARNANKGVRGMVHKGRCGWYVLELTQVPTDQ